MSQLHGILTSYEMRKGGPSDRREASFKASGKGNYYEASHIPEEEEEESNFVRNIQGVLEGSEVSYLLNAFLVEESVTMQPSVFIKINLIKVKDQLNGTKKKT